MPDWNIPAETGNITFQNDSNQVSQLSQASPLVVPIGGVHHSFTPISSIKNPTYDVTPYGVIVMRSEDLAGSPVPTGQTLTDNETSFRIEFSRFCWDSADVRANYDVVFRDFE